MKKFRTALFNGYQKNAVDEYLEDLMQELEVLRQDAFKAQSAGQLRTQLEEIRQENERLQESLQEKSRKLEEEAEQKIPDLWVDRGGSGDPYHGRTGDQRGDADRDCYSGAFSVI